MGVLGLCITANAWASGDPDSTTNLKDIYQSKTIPSTGAGTMYLNPNYSPENGTPLKDYFNYIGKENVGKGLLENDIMVSGVMRTFMLYRDMQTYYDDMTTSPKNISFSTYPLTSITNPTGSYPMLELNLASKYRQNIDFNVGYSMAPVFSGNVQDPNSRSMSVIQNLNFRGSIRNGLFKTTVHTGSVLWVNMSRFTMGQAEYRDNYFDRLPWDWYRRSFERFEEYYKMSTNIGNQQLGRSPLTGLVFETEYLPWALSFRGVYGRTNMSVPVSKAITNFPSYITAGRLEKSIFDKKIMGSVGLTYYAKRAEVQAIVGQDDNRPDNNTVVSADWNLKIYRKFFLSGEFGMGKANNPGTIANKTNNWSPGAVVKFEFDKRQVLYPFSVEYYAITQGLGSVDGGIQNSNPYIGTGGYNVEKIYNFGFIPNLSQEVGQIANNRQGINLRFEGGITKYFKFQLGYASSQEIKNNTDSITIQHRVNAYQRSRMRPWFQADGPYHRIKSAWFRTFESFTIDPTKAGASNTYSKGFNALELLLKSNLKVGNHDLILLNFTSLNTITKGLQVFNVSMTGDNIFIADFYEDFTAAFSINKKLSVVGEAGLELLKGSTMIELSPDKLTSPDADRVVNQIGTTYALGIDYDINRTMNIHLRERYMTQKDTNFSMDKFSGYETTIEFKIFF